MPDMDVPYCTSQIRKAIIEMNSPYNDGYLAWGIKQDLYLLKFMLDKVIADAPTFVGEDEWLKDKEQEVMMEILKK
jgi:hypothetical protein|tara:strand:- start:670 stop:897 length:228 start_codon:yes stop_codon:yes gene_type:complete